MQGHSRRESYVEAQRGGAQQLEIKRQRGHTVNHDIRSSEEQEYRRMLAVSAL